MKTKEINNREDILDSRDIIEHIEELQDKKSNLETALEELNDELEGLDEAEDKEEIEDIKAQIEGAEKSLEEWDKSEEDEELTVLLELQEEAEPHAPDWRRGATLIRRSYFVEYCKELVKDIGVLSENLPGYIENNIDWQGVADDLEMDYTTVDYDGEEYLVR